jgi:hypothetical protein
MTTSTPWAVLLCMFADKVDATPFAPVQTINNLFTSTGDALFNVTHYFRDNSHGTLDLTGSRVFGPFIVPGTKAGPIAGDAARAAAIDAARKVALTNGVPLGNFQFVCVIFNDAIGGNQGSTGWGTIAPLPGVITDYRYVLNGTGDFGHEMGHAYGLQHSRLGAVDEPAGEDWDYQDQWDVMSYKRTLTAPDPNFGQRGPGVNAWNMRSRGWLDESRVWKPSGTTFDQTVQLRPLHRRDLAGSLAAELPPQDGLGGHGRYLVEYRIKQGWDAQFPRSAVFVHRYSAPNSYLLTGVQRGALWLSAQSGPNGGLGAWQLVGAAVGLGENTIGHNADGRLEVFALDATKGSAWHIWQGAPNGAFGSWEIMGDARGLSRISVANNADRRLELFAIDKAAGLAWHNWQVAPNGGWHGWVRLFDAVGLGCIVAGVNADGRIEVFATDQGAGLAWHNWQLSPNGGWHGWQRLGEAAGLGDLAVGRDADGRLNLFALDTSGKLVWRATQTAANAAFGPWGLAVDDRGGFGHIAVGAQTYGALNLIAVDTVGHADVLGGETLNLGLDGGPNVQAQVVKIDDANRTATVWLISHL